MAGESRFGRHRLLIDWALAVGVQALFVIMAIKNSTTLGFPFRMPMFRDIEIYYEAAKPILEGRWPYREYSVEYPILAVVVFFVPLIVGTSFEAYRVGFIIEMMILNAATVWLVIRQVVATEGVARVPSRLTWYTLFFAGLCPLVVIRFDVVPMALSFAAIYCTTRGRMAVGGVLAGVGVLVKLVPGLVLLPVLARSGPWRPKEKLVMGALGAVGLGVIPWCLLGGDQMVESFRYHTVRGIEVGSIYASAYLVAHKLCGVSIMTTYAHGGMNIGGTGVGAAARLSTVLQLTFLSVVAARARKSSLGQEFRFAAAALLAYITFGRVLSPQYLIWLIPFLCVLDGPIGKRARPVFLASVLLTNILYPHRFQALCWFENDAVAVQVIRNLILIGLFAILLGSRPITPTRSSPAACS